MFEMHKNILCESKNGKFKDEMGNSFWYLNGKLHREDGPAVEGPDGRKVWFINGERHREDGPAMILNEGSKFWYLHGMRHREDGPAVEWSNQYKQWFINDVELTEEEFNQWLAKKQLKDNLFLFLDKRYEEKRTKI